MCTNGLFSHADKCKFHFLKIPWIHAISRRPHHGPVQGPDYSRLARTPESQGHSSVTNFYCCFIYGYSENTVLLMHLTCKGTTWHFSDECHSAFETLKKAFTTAPVLTL